MHPSCLIQLLSLSQKNRVHEMNQFGIMNYRLSLLTLLATATLAVGESFFRCQTTVRWSLELGVYVSEMP